MASGWGLNAANRIKGEVAATQTSGVIDRSSWRTAPDETVFIRSNMERKGMKARALMSSA